MIPLNVRGKDFFLRSSRVGSTQRQGKDLFWGAPGRVSLSVRGQDFFLSHCWSALRHPHTSVPWGIRHLQVSVSTTQKSKILLRKEGGITMKSHLPVGARISQCLCWNGRNRNSPFKREKLTELQRFPCFCGNNSSNLQASAHPEGTATAGSRDGTEMPRNRVQLENPSWEIRK